jgi:thymidylate synthase (FAD)
MKLIESKAEYIPQEEGLESIYKQIELAGRTAYHSMDKITPDSAKGFVDRMIKSKHGACLEHGTVYLDSTDMHFDTGRRYDLNPYSKWGSHNPFITSNYRVLVENNWLDDLKYLCSPTEFHEKRYTMRFTCSRAIAQELTRHRTFSFLMESQRYINYSKERHGGEITFIIPSWMPQVERHIDTSNGFGVLEGEELYAFLGKAERHYFYLLDKGLQPQQARDVLPNATKTELIMTGFSSDWRFLVDLRLFEKTGTVHPDMLNLMLKAQEVMIEAGIWEDIMKQPSKFE